MTIIYLCKKDTNVINVFINKTSADGYIEYCIECQAYKNLLSNDGIDENILSDKVCAVLFNERFTVDDLKAEIVNVSEYTVETLVV